MPRDRIIRITSFVLVLLSIMFVTSCSSEMSDEYKNEVINHLRTKIYDTLPYSDDMVFWVKGGSVYHLYDDCRFLQKADEIRHGTITMSGRTKACETCTKRLEVEAATQDARALSNEHPISDAGVGDSEQDTEIISASTEVLTEETATTNDPVTDDTTGRPTETTDPESREKTTEAPITPLETIRNGTGADAERNNPENSDRQTTKSADNNTQTVYWTPGGSVWHVDPNCPSLSRSKDVRSGTVEDSGKSRGCKKCSE